jgi:hypothetical protein
MQTEAMNVSNQAINANGSEPDANPESNGYIAVRAANISQDGNKDIQQNVSCKTCNSIQECEEDADNPGDYYCKRCWEEYALLSQQKHGDAMEEKWGALLGASDTAARGDAKDDLRTNGNPVCNGVKDVQSLATQSPSECEMLQTQAMSMTQPQTQTLTQPPESQTRTSPDEVCADEDVDQNQSSTELEREKESSTTEVERKSSQIADSKVDGGSDPAEIQAASDESKQIDTLGDGCNSNQFESKEAAVDVGEVLVADERRESIAEQITDNETAVLHATAKSDDENEAADGAASGEDFTSQATVQHENVTKRPNGDLSNADKISCVNAGAQINTEGEQADTTNMHAGNENDAKSSEGNASFECADHGNSDDDDDQDASFMTQEMNLTKVTGLLTQAGTLSDNEEEESDAMDEDVVEKGGGIDLEYEGVKMNAEVSRPPTIDTSDQIPLSGLTGPSQHLSMSHKSDNNSALVNEDLADVETPSNHETLPLNSNEPVENDKSSNVAAGPETSGESDNSGEAIVNKDQSEIDVDRDHDTQDAGLTEDTFGSLYGAQTQILPAAAPQTSNADDEKCTDEHEQNALTDEAGQTKTDQDDKSMKESIGREEEANPGTPERKSTDHANMKVTPQRGVLSMVSYPNDHEQNNDTNEAQGDDDPMDRDDQNETQESLDLLETSPVSKKQEKKSTRPNVKSPVNPINENAQKLAEKNATIVGEAWISNRDAQKSPRFVLPATKSNAAKKVDVGDPAKAAERESLTADDSDDESLFDHCNAHPLDNDPIEDTQTEDLHHQQQRTSSLKRLSRGTPIYPSKEGAKTVSLPISTRTFNSTLGTKQYGKRSKSGSKSSITPKVLQYARPQEDIESEAEFEDDNEITSPLLEKSQTDYSASKLLDEIEEFTKKLPSADELSDLASRKELQQEIYVMRKSHTDEVKDLKAEITKLRRLVTQKEGMIREKEQEIDEIKDARDEAIRKKNAKILEKDAALKEMSSEFNELKGKAAKLVKRLKLAEQAKNRDAVVDNSENGALAPSVERTKDSSGAGDDDSENESLVLSALKRPSTTENEKKQSGKESTSKPGSSAGKSKKRSAQKDDSRPRPLSPQIWKQLQEKGWEYKTGPEPHNKGQLML